MSTRVRFSSGATGRLNVDDARVALYNWLFARHHEGTFVLRIQDMGPALPGVGEAIGEDLRWLGIDWDEGPVHQSERLSLYREVARRLVAEGAAYLCYCSSGGAAPVSDCPCREPSAAQRAKREAQGISPAVCFSVTSREPVAYDDIVFHAQAAPGCMLDGWELLTPDGLPTLHLANVVDDHDQAITHVIRGHEHLPATPLSLLLCEALGWAPPRFAHLPPLGCPDVGTTALSAYRDEGYLGLAVANYVARLGWTPRGKRELLSLAELAKRFELGRVSHSPPRSDLRQLDWFSQHCLSRLDAAEVARLMAPYWQRAYGVSDRAEGTALSPAEWQQELAAAIVGEVAALSGAADKARFAFDDAVVRDARAEQILAQPYAGEVLRAFAAGITGVAPFGYGEIDAFVSGLRWRFKASHGVRSRDVMSVMRAALTGRVDGPCLIVACQLLGGQRCSLRAARALAGGDDA